MNLFSFFTEVAQAHEKWFVTDIPAAPAKPLLFSAWNSMNSSFVLIGIFALVAALLIHFILKSKRWVRRIRSLLSAYKNWVSFIMRTLTGLLLFVASYSGFFFAPDLRAIDIEGAARFVLLAIQLFAGLGLLLGIFPRFMSVFGFTLYLAMFFFFPPLSVLSYLTFIGIFVYLFIVGDPALPKVKGGSSWFPHLKALFEIKDAQPHAQYFLRLCAGAAFLLVGYLYKIYEPAYALEFVRSHGVNFMPAIGFANFTNEMFVFAAGVAEIFIGLLLVFGLLPRFVGGFLIAIFTFTIAVFGVYELLGHLPLYAVAFALLIQGGGEISRKAAQ